MATVKEVRRVKTKERKRDADQRGVEYMLFVVNEHSDLADLQSLSHRGWRVAVGLGPSKVLLSRPEGWND